MTTEGSASQMTTPTPSQAERESAIALEKYLAECMTVRYQIPSAQKLADFLAAHRAAPSSDDTPNQIMSRDDMLYMVDSMLRYGGSFVKALSECFILADRENLARLFATFPEYVKQYTEMAQIEAERQAQKGNMP